MPRLAMTSTGMQPSKNFSFSKSFVGAFSAVTSAFQNASYSSFVIGQLM